MSNAQRMKKVSQKGKVEETILWVSSRALLQQIVTIAAAAAGGCSGRTKPMFGTHMEE